MAQKPYNYLSYSQMRRLPQQSAPVPKRRKRPGRWLAGLLIVALLIGGGVWYASINNNAVADNATVTQQHKATTTKKPAATSQAPATVAKNECAANTAGGKLALVSISQRHMWACNDTAVAYDAPVITGMEFLAADLTPVGTYHVYGKYTDTVLRGSDSTGSWDDPVSYWMPWLHNQYGSYGFHDATWRSSNEFGNVDPNTSDASHGCVELPLDAAAWLYNWAEIGTTVTIEA